MAARRQYRYKRGEREYGHLMFLLRDGLQQDVLEEIADAINWLEMLYVKVAMMKTEGT